MSAANAPIVRSPVKSLDNKHQAGRPATALVCIVAAVMTVFTLSCASKTLEPYPGRTVDQCPSREAKEGLTVAIYPMSDPEEIKRYFGQDLAGAGVLPVLVVVENRSQASSFLIDSEHCMIVNAADKGRPDLGNVNKERAEWLGMSSLGLIGAGFGASRGADAQDRRYNLAMLELRRQTVSPGKSAQGFVYFRNTKKVRNGAQTYIVRIEAQEMGGGQATQFEFPLDIR